VPIIINSDAHDPSYVGDFSEAYKLLKELNFDEKLILNTSIEKFKAFIGC
jgi:putative hydrolase